MNRKVVIFSIVLIATIIFLIYFLTKYKEKFDSDIDDLNKLMRADDQFVCTSQVWPNNALCALDVNRNTSLKDINMVDCNVALQNNPDHKLTVARIIIDEEQKNGKIIERDILAVMPDNYISTPIRDTNCDDLLKYIMQNNPDNPKIKTICPKGGKQIQLKAELAKRLCCKNNCEK